MKSLTEKIQYVHVRKEKFHSYSSLQYSDAFSYVFPQKIPTTVSSCFKRHQINISIYSLYILVFSFRNCHGN